MIAFLNSKSGSRVLTLMYYLYYSILTMIMITKKMMISKKREKMRNRDSPSPLRIFVVQRIHCSSIQLILNESLTFRILSTQPVGGQYLPAVFLLMSKPEFKTMHQFGTLMETDAYLLLPSVKLDSKMVVLRLVGARQDNVVLATSCKGPIHTIDGIGTK